MIIYFVISIIFLLFIYFISYWFVKIAELTEYFKNPECSQIQCNVKFVNDRLKDAFTWIPYLEKNIEIIEANLPQQLTVENFETFEKNDDCKISQPRILSQFGKIETIYRDIYEKQLKMQKMLNKFEKAIKFANKKTNENCFQIENSNECQSDTLKNQIANIYHKLDEVEYRTGRLFKKIEKHYNRLIEFEKKKNIAIGEVANKANDIMKNLFGVPVDLKLGDHLKAGISDNMKSNIKSAMGGDISKLTSLVNSPEIQNMAKMINPANLLGKLSGSKPSDSSQFSDKGKNVVGNALNDEEDEDAVKAKSKMGGALKKIKLPSMFSSNVF